MDVIKKIQLKTLSILLFLGLVLSCSKENTVLVDCETYDYADCNQEEPLTSEMNLQFTIGPNIRWVAFDIYKGTFDKGELIISDTTWSSSLTYTMPTSQYYTVRARYQLDGKTIYIVGG